jgi:esterase/lipase superfamily enzyme
LPAELRSTRLPVFYAITRAPAPPGKAGHYTNRAGDGMQLGVADVPLGDPDWTWDDLVASHRTAIVNRGPSGVVQAPEEFGESRHDGHVGEAERRFLARIDEQLARARNGELVLYVHGYRVTFDEISVQMGSFAHYLGHGAMVTFQWPTGLNVWNYITDCPRADVRLQVIDVSDVRELMGWAACRGWLLVRQRLDLHRHHPVATSSLAARAALPRQEAEHAGGLAAS